MQRHTCHVTHGRIRLQVARIRGRPDLARRLETRLADKDQLRSIRARPITGSVIVFFDGDGFGTEQVLAILDNALCDLERSHPVSVAKNKGATYGRASGFFSGRRLLMVLFLTGITLYHLLTRFIFRSHLNSAWSIFGVLIGGVPLFRRALFDIQRRRFLSAHSFLSAATLLATASGQSAAALEVLWIQEMGQLMEEYIQDRSRRTLRALLLVIPPRAYVLVDGAEMEKSISDIRKGDILSVHNGERIAVDGVVSAGAALVDESHITGRAEPELRNDGDGVFAGTIVQQGHLRVKAEKVGDQTYLAQVTRIVENALAARAPAERRADRLSARLAGLGTTASASTWLFTRSLSKTLAVQLALASPCATVMAASTAVTAALAHAARKQVLIKGGIYLERFAATDCICFDKTGTLTVPLPAVERIIPRTPQITKNRILSMAAAAQYHNTHPIARALVRAAPANRKQCVDSEVFLGRGVKARLDADIITVGNAALMKEEQIDIRYFQAAAEKLENAACTVLYVSRNDKLQGLIALKYTLKSGADRILRALRAEGVYHLHLISGDAAKVVMESASGLELNGVRGDLRPEEKAEYVADLMDSGRRVAMVGDGINDAPALARAQIGIAMGAAGAEAAIEAADIALADNELERLVWTRRLSRQTLRIIEQNHWFAVTTDLLGAVLAITGAISPLLSGALHMAHTMTIMANSSRLLRFETNAHGFDEK